MSKLQGASNGDHMDMPVWTAVAQLFPALAECGEDGGPCVHQRSGVQEAPTASIAKQTCEDGKQVH